MPATSSGQHLLQPNRAPDTRRRQTILVEANSIDRNYTNQIAPNPLKFQFARPVKDVTSIELLSGTIPAFPFNITKANGSFTFAEGSTQVQLTIPPGQYSPASLVTQLQSLFATTPVLTNTYSVSLVNGYLYINLTAGVQPYAFLFASGTPSDTLDRNDGFLITRNTPANLLGFDINDYYSVAGELKSPFIVNTTTTRLYLYVNFDNTNSFSTVERGSGRRSPFAILYLDQATDGYKFLNKETLTPASYICPQPYARVQNLYIEFRDEFYRLIDFGGKDFTLLFNITVLE